MRRRRWLPTSKRRRRNGWVDKESVVVVCGVVCSSLVWCSGQTSIHSSRTRTHMHARHGGCQTLPITSCPPSTSFAISYPLLLISADAGWPCSNPRPAAVAFGISLTAYGHLCHRYLYARIIITMILRAHRPSALLPLFLPSLFFSPVFSSSLVFN